MSSNDSHASLNDLKLEFVSDIHGTTLFEILTLLLVVPCFGRHSLWLLPLEFGVFVLPFLFISTVGSTWLSATDSSGLFAFFQQRFFQAADVARWRQEKAVLPADAYQQSIGLTWPVYATMLCLAAIVWHHLKSCNIGSISLDLPVAGRGSSWLNWPERRVAGFRKQFLTFYRSQMMLFTCVSILAVDFDVFPRRFAKCETFGVSLMDVGVGCFVFSMALVAAARRPAKGAARGALALLLLGAARAGVTAVSGLPAHVSEYGVHWNFFLTLALVALGVSFFTVERAGLCSVLLGVAYQCALSGGLSEYIVSHERDNLLHANKEGLCSWLGFLAIYLAGLAVGRSLLREQSRAQWWRRVAETAMVAVACGVFMYVLSERVQEPSRRMANLTYVAMIVCVNCFVLSLSLAVSLVTLGCEMPLIEAINFNSLAVFLFANVTTGAVNLSIQSIHTRPAVALAVLFLYMTVVCSFALILKKLEIKIKI